MKILLFLLFFTISCKQTLTENNSSNHELLKKECSCNFVYEPVCANGITFDNECLAKCNGTTNIKKGKCLCSKRSQRICASPPMPTCPKGAMCTQVMPSPKVYNNECEMIEAKATFLRNGNCP